MSLTKKEARRIAKTLIDDFRKAEGGERFILFHFPEEKDDWWGESSNLSTEQALIVAESILWDADIKMKTLKKRINKIRKEEWGEDYSMFTRIMAKINRIIKSSPNGK
ncbi:MAG TPA: hypothetical protein ENH85_06325 [Candidatus Scalindua sp.]|nr:hypothetical protein [Candidatus Scalindua sp.]